MSDKKVYCKNCKDVMERIETLENKVNTIESSLDFGCEVEIAIEKISDTVIIAREILEELKGE